MFFYIISKIIMPSMLVDVGNIMHFVNDRLLKNHHPLTQVIDSILTHVFSFTFYDL